MNNSQQLSNRNSRSIYQGNNRKAKKRSNTEDYAQNNIFRPQIQYHPIYLNKMENSYNQNLQPIQNILAQQLESPTHKNNSVNQISQNIYTTPNLYTPLALRNKQKSDILFYTPNTEMQKQLSEMKEQQIKEINKVKSNFPQILARSPQNPSYQYKGRKLQDDVRLEDFMELDRVSQLNYNKYTQRKLDKYNYMFQSPPTTDLSQDSSIQLTKIPNALQQFQQNQSSLLKISPQKNLSMIKQYLKQSPNKSFSYHYCCSHKYEPQQPVKKDYVIQQEILRNQLEEINDTHKIIDLRLQLLSLQKNAGELSYASDFLSKLRLNQEQFQRAAEVNHIFSKDQSHPHTATSGDESTNSYRPELLSSNRLTVQDNFEIQNYLEQEQNLYSTHVSFGYEINQIKSQYSFKLYPQEELELFNWRFTDRLLQRGQKYIYAENVKLQRKVVFQIIEIVDFVKNHDDIKDLHLILYFPKTDQSEYFLHILSDPVAFLTKNNELKIYLELEYFITMKTLIEQRVQPYSEEELLFIMRSVLKSYISLEYINVTHGDICIENIVLCPKLIDNNLYYKLINFSKAISHTIYKQDFISEKERDIKCNDIFCLGVSFIYIKYLVKQKDRNLENLLEFVQRMKSEELLSSKIIIKMVDSFEFRPNAALWFYEMIEQKLTKMPIEQTKEIENYVSDQPKANEYMALQYSFLAQTKKAIEYYTNALETQIKNYGPDAYQLLHNHRNIFTLAFQDNNPQLHALHNKRYFDLYKKLNLPENELLALELFESAQQNWEFNMKQNAIDDLEYCVKIRKQTMGEWHKDTLEAVNLLGQYYLKMGNYEKAQEVLTRAIELMRSQNIKDELYASQLFHLGNIYYNQQMYDKSLDLLEEYYKLEKGQKNDKDFAQVCCQVGSMYYRLQNFAKAKFYFVDCIGLAEKFYRNSDETMINYKKNFAFVLHKLGDPKDVDFIIDSIEALSEDKIDDRKKNCYCIFQLTEVLQVMGYLDEARESYINLLSINDREFFDNVFREKIKAKILQMKGSEKIDI